MAPSKSSPESRNEEVESFCFDERTKLVTHLSHTSPKDLRFSKRERAGEVSPGYLYWESVTSHHNHRYDEKHRTYIEFVELKQQLQVVSKTLQEVPRIAFNGLCRETRRVQ